MEIVNTAKNAATAAFFAVGENVRFYAKIVKIVTSKSLMGWYFSRDGLIF